MFSAPHKKILLLAALCLVIWLSVRFLLPIALPFILAALLALAAEPLVGFFHHKAGLSRSLSAGIGVTLTLGLLALAAMILGALLLRQLENLVGVVPDLEGTALDGLAALQSWLLGVADSAPAPIQSIARHSVEDLFAGSSDLVDQLSAWALGLASRLVSKLPGSALSVGTWLLAGYMISGKLPLLRSAIAKRLPKNWLQNAITAFQNLKKAVFGWFGAQLKLMSVTFAVLALGLWLLRFSHWAVWAGVISLLDALPVLGSGMALVPWSIVCLIRGDTLRAIGLLAIYAAALVLRSILEPRLIGKELGLDPLLTLAVMYAGYRLWGFGGMILSPLLAVTATQFFRAMSSS